MKSTNDFIKDFMCKLENNAFKKDILDTETNIEPLTMDSVEKHIKDFDKVLKSDIVQAIMNLK